MLAFLRRVWAACFGMDAYPAPEALQAAPWDAADTIVEIAKKEASAPEPTAST
jgi:hypothetical protein